MVGGCAEQGWTSRRAAPASVSPRWEAVTYATTVDSLLAVKYLVFDKSLRCLSWRTRFEPTGRGTKCSRPWQNRAPKYGRDDGEADALALRVMQLWCDETWRHQTRSPGAGIAGYAQLELLGGRRHYGGQRRRTNKGPVPPARSVRPTGADTHGRPPTPIPSGKCWAAKLKTAGATGWTI